MNEVIEIQKRSLYTIIRGFEESPSKDINECIRFDTEYVNKLFSLCSESLNNIVNNTRLGHPVVNKSRPIKLTLRNNCDVDRFISSFLTTKRKSPSSVINISVVKDRPKTERHLIMDIYTDYNNRVNAGEQNIKVHYFNGQPKIVTTTLKTNSDGRSQ